MFQNLPDDISASYYVAAALRSEAVLSQVQHALRRILPSLTVDHLRELVSDEILRPETLQGEHAEHAQALLKRLTRLQAKGLNTLETQKVIARPPTPDEESEDVNQILLDDKHFGGSGG